MELQKINVCVDIVYSFMLISEIDQVCTSEEYILLVLRKNPPYQGCWALPGGFVENNETLEQAALRELKEETDCDLESLDLVTIADKVDRDPRGRTISGVFMTYEEGETLPKIKAGDDASDCYWVKVSELNELNLAFDHKELIEEWLEL